MTQASAIMNSDRESVFTRIASGLQSEGFQGARCTWLPGDASNRYYGRLHFDSAPQGGPKRALLMVMNAPEAFKSEEVTGSDETKLIELPFVTIARAWKIHGIRTPEIFFVDSKSEYLVLEDLGDELLYDRRQKEAAITWYERAMDELSRIQKVPAFVPVKNRRFTEELLTWETEHFIEYALEKRNKGPSAADLKTLRDFFARIVQAMVSTEQVPVHRDYHSKNLLPLQTEGRIGVIDFQDALMGPTTYDLASLLRDSYVKLTDEEEAHLLRYFEKVSGRIIDRKLFAWTSLQRNLKAVGRFYYIDLVKGRKTHLPYVSPSLGRIAKTLSDCNEDQVIRVLKTLLSEEGFVV